MNQINTHIYTSPSVRLWHLQLVPTCVESMGRFKFGGLEDGMEEWFREGGSMRPLPKWDVVTS